MTTSLTKRFVATAAVAVAALGAASVAHARSDVTWSIGISSPGVYVQPAPVYVPQPVYVQPRPVYVQPPPIYVQPAPVYYPPQIVYTQPPAYGYYYYSPDWRRAEWERRHGWRHRHHHGQDDDRGWQDGGR